MAQPTAYQRVSSQYDITEAGVTSLDYLAFDGSDDTLILPDIPFNSDTGFNAFMGADTTELGAGPISAIGRSSSAAVDSYGAYFGGGTDYAPSVFDQQTLLSVDARFRAIGAATRRKAVFAWQASLTNTNERTAVVRIDQTETTEVYTKDNLATSEVFNALCSVAGLQFAKAGVFVVIIRCAAPLTAGEISSTESYVANLSGVSI